MLRFIATTLMALPLSLAAQPAFFATDPGPYYVAAGDLNGDGKSDLVIACRGELLSPALKRPANDTISVFLSDKHGNFQQGRTFPAGFGPYTTAIGDLDGDKLPDVVVANFQSNDGRDLAILYGIKDRARLFEPTQYVRTEGGDFDNDKTMSRTGALVYATPGLTSVALHDFNRDGRTDMAAVAWTSDFLVIYLNKGNRAFEQRRYPLPPGPRDVVVGDFDGDKIEDLAMTIYSSNMAQVWRGDAKGAFTLWRQFHSAGQTPYHLKAGDLDKDGRLDLVVGNRSVQDNVAVFRNTPARFALVGSFSPDTPQKGETTADEIRDVYLRDLDGDGRLDLVAACHISHKVVIWKGTGDLTYGNAFRDRKEIMYPGKGPRAIASTGDKLAVALFDSNQLVIIDTSK